MSPLGSKLLSKIKSIVPLRSQIDFVKSKLGNMQDKPTQRLIDRFNSREGLREDAKEYIMPN